MNTVTIVGAITWLVALGAALAAVSAKKAQKKEPRLIPVPVRVKAQDRNVHENQ